MTTTGFELVLSVLLGAVVGLTLVAGFALLVTRKRR
jgi:hypothetical protein